MQPSTNDNGAIRRGSEETIAASVAVFELDLASSDADWDHLR